MPFGISLTEVIFVVGSLAIGLAALAFVVTIIVRTAIRFRQELRGEARRDGAERARP